VLKAMDRPGGDWNHFHSEITLYFNKRDQFAIAQSGGLTSSLWALMGPVLYHFCLTNKAILIAFLGLFDQ
jgi:hypothetical protein